MWFFVAQSTLLWSSLPVLQMFLPIYLQENGRTPTEIGILMALGPAMAIVLPPLIGLVADQAKSKNHVLLVLTAGGALAAWLYPFARGFPALVLIGVVIAVFQSGQGPLSEAILIEGLDRTRRSYGPVRLAGTLGFAVTALAVGASMGLNPTLLFWLTGLLTAINLLVVLRLPLVQGHQSHGPRLAVWALFRDRKLTQMLVFTLIASVSIGFYSNFFGLFFLSLGGTRQEIGILLFLMAISEIPFLLGADRVLARWGRRRLMALAMAVLAVRALVLAGVSAPVWMYPISLVNGLTFIIFSYGIATYIARECDKGLRATGQAVSGVAMSTGRVIGAVLGGVLVEGWGLPSTFLALSALGAATLVLFLMTSREQPTPPSNA